MNAFDWFLIAGFAACGLWSNHIIKRAVSDVKTLRAKLNDALLAKRDLLDQLALAKTMLGAAEEKLAATRERADRAEQMYVRLRRGM